MRPFLSKAGSDSIEGTELAVYLYYASITINYITYTSQFQPKVCVHHH